jgi:hypothetical protein
MATRPEIIEKVKQRLDEISPFADDEVDAVQLIDKILDESATTIRLKAPVSLLNHVGIDVTLHQSRADGTGYIPLAQDFLRLHTFKLNLWKVPVSEANIIDINHPKYKLQQHTSTRGGTVKPVVVIRPLVPAILVPKWTLNQRMLEYFSVPVGTATPHDIDYARYIKTGTAQEIEDILVDTLAWQCAGDVYVIQEMPEQAQVAYAKVKEFIDKQTL